ncbi:hypothetical protein Mp_8g02520 [Marchantia polymorpha subsp. ruderalis]|uniref:Uncharacterized protein n=1 Tax=Marchantia polymorpha TaxID=3197 RepID=A0A2R6XIZ7_MARPO|nr:hypothetical protein MARPO_0012s0049 [Marchantia polymorpha]BBN18441.1 hypothetical protein Mp_8g02520 [Marchantia polymorpha subsp. ruderalis]|eukprot:PTQ46088.1 hypothetical protein MARPO_0012s0049 [Marchantia polymorpha]
MWNTWKMMFPRARWVKPINSEITSSCSRLCRRLVNQSVTGGVERNLPIFAPTRGTKKRLYTLSIASSTASDHIEPKVQELENFQRERDSKVQHCEHVLHIVSF